MPVSLAPGHQLLQGWLGEAGVFPKDGNRAGEGSGALRGAGEAQVRPHHPLQLPEIGSGVLR